MLPRPLTLAACLCLATSQVAAQDVTQAPSLEPAGAVNGGLVLPGMAAAMALMILAEMGGMTTENPGTGTNPPSGPGSF